MIFFRKNVVSFITSFELIHMTVKGRQKVRCFSHESKTDKIRTANFLHIMHKLAKLFSTLRHLLRWVCCQYGTNGAHDTPSQCYRSMTVK